MTSLTQELLSELRTHAAADPTLRIARNAVSSVGVAKAGLDQDKIAAINAETEHKLDSLSVTNQRRSGRCWMFAALNVFRHRAAKELGLKDFEFSFTYLQYYDKIERVNLVTRALAERSDADLDEREISVLLDNANADGGWWNFFYNLVSKYGAVPAQVMPETNSSGDTGALNRALATIVRRAALSVRSGSADDAADATDTADAAAAAAVADAQRVLAVHLGVPPALDQPFDFAYRTKDNEFRRQDFTPQQFAEKFLPNLDDYVCLGADPREDNPRGRVYYNDKATNVEGGQPYTYLNLEVEELRKAASAAIADGEPVWFSCDVNRHFSFDHGVWDEGLLDIDLLYGIDTSTTKEERFVSGDSVPTHAMLLTGHSAATGLWRVENSWGEKNPRTKEAVTGKGYGTATTEWFDNNVFHVVVRREFLDEAQRAALETTPIALPDHDRMI